MGSSKRRRLRRPSPAMVVACISLSVALSGAGYAAVTLPRNSVGTPQLKADAVTGAKVKNNSLGGADVKESTFGIVPNANRLDGLDSTAFLRDEGGTIEPGHLAALPAARTYAGEFFDIPNNTLVTIPMAGTLFDSDGMWSDAQPTRLTAPRSGTYIASAAVSWPAGPGPRSLLLERNGQQIGHDTRSGADGASQIVTVVTRMEAGQYIHMRIRQISGSTQTTSICGSSACPSLSLAWIGP